MCKVMSANDVTFSENDRVRAYEESDESAAENPTEANTRQAIIHRHALCQLTLETTTWGETPPSPFELDGQRANKVAGSAWCLLN